jgi:hypothetical protein
VKLRRPDAAEARTLKLGLFFSAAGIWLLGALTGREWLVLVAIALLAAGLALRWWGRN